MLYSIYKGSRINLVTLLGGSHRNMRAFLGRKHKEMSKDYILKDIPPDLHKAMLKVKKKHKLTIWWQLIEGVKMYHKSLGK